MEKLNPLSPLEVDFLKIPSIELMGFFSTKAVWLLKQTGSIGEGNERT